MTSDAWDPVIYERFKAQRSQPFHDLVELVHGPTPRMIDLGCGTGELTRWAVERLGATSALGLDSSPAMLREAAGHALPGLLAFAEGDLAEWTSDGDHDLVLSNAALHWTGDHPGVLSRWTRALAPGGQLAVQVPANGDAPSHTVAVELAHEEPFASAFGAAGPPPDAVIANVLTPVAYSQLLFDLGYDDQSVRLQVYAHVMPSSRSVVDWVTGTTLTRFKAALPVGLYDEFVRRYESRLVAVLGRREPYLFPFRRILLWGRRPA